MQLELKSVLVTYDIYLLNGEIVSLEDLDKIVESSEMNGGFTVPNYERVSKEYQLFGSTLNKLRNSDSSLFACFQNILDTEYKEIKKGYVRWYNLLFTLKESKTQLYVDGDNNGFTIYYYDTQPRVAFTAVSHPSKPDLTLTYKNIVDLIEKIIDLCLGTFPKEKDVPTQMVTVDMDKIDAPKPWRRAEITKYGGAELLH